MSTPTNHTNLSPWWSPWWCTMLVNLTFYSAKPDVRSWRYHNQNHQLLSSIYAKQWSAIKSSSYILGFYYIHVYSIQIGVQWGVSYCIRMQYKNVKPHYHITTSHRKIVSIINTIETYAKSSYKLYLGFVLFPHIYHQSSTHHNHHKKQIHTSKILHCKSRPFYVPECPLYQFSVFVSVSVFFACFYGSLPAINTLSGYSS